MVGICGFSKHFFSYAVKFVRDGAAKSAPPINNTPTPGGGATDSSGQITLSQSESADPVQINQPFSYTVSFANNATAVASSVKLSDTLPKKTRLVSALTSLGKKCKGKAPVVCNFGTVASGDTVTDLYRHPQENRTDKKFGIYYLQNAENWQQEKEKL